MSQTWFITGASRGLGRAIALNALESGDNVVATARRPEQLDDLATTHGDSLLVLPLDVTDAAAATTAINRAVEHFGALDVVVNNAGYGDVAAVEDVTLDDFRAQMDTNFYGTLHVTKAAVPHLRAQGSGHIVQISSVGDRVTTPGLAAYQAAKFAVAGLSEVLAQEVASFGVHVTVVEPGAMRTDWAGSSMTIPEVSEPYQASVGQMAQMMRQFDGQQTGDPAKVAAAIRTAVTSAEPPVRLLLGADAYQYATEAGEKRATEDTAWREVTESIAYDA